MEGRVVTIMGRIVSSVVTSRVKLGSVDKKIQVQARGSDLELDRVEFIIFVKEEFELL